MYFVMAILLTFGFIFELTCHAKTKYSFFILILGLSCILCFRYGQGTDYYAYYIQYIYTPYDFDNLISILSQVHGEAGWYFLIFIAKTVELPYEGFIIILSCIMMFCSFKVIRKYSPYKICSLILLFPTYYLTYYFSAIRQGLVLSIFLGYGLPLLLQKQNKKYYLCILILCLFHKSALILILLPMILKHYYYIRRRLLFICGVIAILGYSGTLGQFWASVVGSLSYINVSVSVPATVIRGIYFLLIAFMHKQTKFYNLEIEKKLYIIYSFGFYIYLCLSFSDILSQRITMPMKSLEIILLPIELFIIIRTNNVFNYRSTFNNIEIVKVKNTWRSNKLLTIVCSAMILFIPNVELYKNVDSYLVQGNYYAWVSPIEYPYISIWNEDDIWEYVSHFDEELD